ncbi:rhamnosyltransferase [Yersinia mollaretii]|uniref:dTDP-rhamnosyl transferase RfbF n=1 Tax=Yersinia mollaretii TaxID=33060 RepID=A0AA36LNB8_YERMO|nr:rhamnosyltransferase [Yersinia mollaretii]MDA5526653.1 rhamnosyltransferase [Yersinia mollaretii]MDR7873444.1 rhamnosyltransferase [Yersinia mollaretii]PHZ32274.1 rhamnosyltransferase [Yersinia mollaretii]WQC76680.1 rhamnosyltransferase [Yersinia mollaretii]CNH96850.1 dTDP-rhamnosyl transferase RfbF [Yersinia mollaretii]
MNASPYSICAVIVTFNPELDVFKRLIESISPQVDRVIIVDNASLSKVRLELEKIAINSPSIHLISFPDNMGIASAQNSGIKMAIDMESSHILLLDHDSIPAGNMVEKLLSLELKLLSQKREVGAVGPTLVDRRTSTRSGFVRKEGILIKRIYIDDLNAFVETDFLIASGTLIRTEVLQNVGLMKDGYFIDHVDTEWCFRAVNFGYKLFGCGDAFLNHNLGDSVIQIWVGRWREIPKHSPLRNYYIFRNTIHMVTTTPMSTSWKLTHVYRLMLFFVFFMIVAKPRYRRFKMMIKGSLDGIRGVSGKIVM